MFHQTIDSSQATVPMSIAGLEEILLDARAGNEARHITGALVYVEGVFPQVLECDREALLGTLAR